eukprot:TRINITY_DN2322_c0_g2_i1.p1 TRINITY_DN2322_c0_g2~~TRINITY_DN2322_c0_g2_i1.p1  ORF type:complete len:563 (+),score=60.32 TRINITY_DN2322_c0_g2_i1:61-1749(+)
MFRFHCRFNSTASAPKKPSRIGTKILGFLGIGVAVGAGVGYFKYRTDPSFARTITFWSKCGPILGHYRWVEAQGKLGWLKEPALDAEYNRLHHLYADQLVSIIRELRGFYIKLGQVLASRADIFPQVWLERLRTLEDACPARPFDEIKQIVETSMGKPLSEIFSEFDPQPLGSASIGQVHRARLRRNGQVVAVKIQYPGVEKLFRGDIKTMRDFAEIAQPEQAIIFNEIEKQFMTEFNYRLEGENLRQVRDNINVKFGNRVAVPEPYLDLCTREVLVMEYFKGEKLMDAMDRMVQKAAKDQGKTVSQLTQEYRDKLLKEGGMSEQQSTPTAWQLRWYRYWVLAQTLCYNVWATGYNWLVSPLLGGKKEYREYDLPLNYMDIIQTLIEVHAHEIFVDGVFNGDPHPGNILMLEDGRLGLIDYGQVKRLTAHHRHLLARMIVALAEEDEKEVVKLALISGCRWKKNDPWVINKQITVTFDRDSREVCEGMNIQSFVEYLHARDPIVQMIDDFFLPCRVSLLLRAFGYGFGVPVSFAKLSKSVCLEVLRKEVGENWRVQPTHWND